MPLSAAIAALREELLRACWDSSQQSLRFKPSPVELTLQVAVTSAGKGKAGVHWWLIELGGEASRESAVTQTVKMKLEPVMFSENGQPVELLIDAPEAIGERRISGETPLDAAG